MNIFTSLFTDLSTTLFTPLMADDPGFLALVAGGFLTLQDGGKIELHK
ncbi:MAG: hypothetical protein OEV92_00375 [Nitrospinota bacterium]|nr:hypothetical protein [Nitrospinota bacterium]